MFSLWDAWRLWRRRREGGGGGRKSTAQAVPLTEHSTGSYGDTAVHRRKERGRASEIEGKMAPGMSKTLHPPPLPPPRPLHPYPKVKLQMRTPKKRGLGEVAGEHSRCGRSPGMPLTSACVCFSEQMSAGCFTIPIYLSMQRFSLMHAFVHVQHPDSVSQVSPFLW